MIVEHARPLIEAIAAWETERGTICAILPHEYEDFITVLKRAAAKPTCSARAALSAAQPIATYNEYGQITQDFPDHVAFMGDRYMVLIASVFDDGETVGPYNTEAVSPNITEAHAYIEKRFSVNGLQAKRHGDNSLSGYSIINPQTGKDLDITIVLSLIEIETA